jgi:hypothetical protein
MMSMKAINSVHIFNSPKIDLLTRPKSSGRRPAVLRVVPVLAMSAAVFLKSMSIPMEERFKAFERKWGADCGWRDGLDLKQIPPAAETWDLSKSWCARNGRENTGEWGVGSITAYTLFMSTDRR